MCWYKGNMWNVEECTPAPEKLKCNVEGEICVVK